MCRSNSLAVVTTENTDYEFFGAVTLSQVDSASVLCWWTTMDGAPLNE